MLSDRPRGALSETRKITKSAMEKKRRARINTSLVELKTILGGMLSHKTERFDKMEKADILEMTVRYVKQLQRKSEQVSSPTKTKDEDYKNGVNSCISEVIKYIASSHSCDEEIKAKLLDHLANRLTGVDEPGSRQDYKSAMSASSDSDQSDSDSGQTESPSQTDSIPKPVTVNTQTVCPTAITLSPGANTNQINIQGQFAGTTLQTSPVVNTLQQASPITSNIPFTIIVPANLYSSVAGTACVIPLSIATTANTHVAATSVPSNNIIHNISPVSQHQSDSQRTVYVGMQHTQCVTNSATVNNATLKSSELRVGGVAKTIETCNTETSNARKENFHIKTPSCSRSHHSPVINSLSKEQMRAEDLWRPW